MTNLVMKATVRLRIFGDLINAAIVKALPKTPIIIIKIVMTPEKRLNPKDDLQKQTTIIQINFDVNSDSRIP